MKRVQYQLKATGVKKTPLPLSTGTHTRGYLPHVKREGASYFVTFRLADSLPKQVMYELLRDRAEKFQAIVARQKHPTKQEQTAERVETAEDAEREYFRKIEEYLDRGSGECVLKKPEIAQVVASALKFFEGVRYRLDDWVVMPNHVHVVLWPAPNYSLSEILRSLKRYTGREINKLLARTGHRLWQPESYDHWIRKDEEHARCCSYVVRNPVKPRLCAAPEQWRWSSAFQASGEGCNADL
jgi:putative transposase